MKIATKRIGLIFLIIAALCVFHMITPTFGLQIPFNEWVWKNDPNHRIRYYMSESLVEKLNTEKPDIMQTADMLGQESMGGSRITSGDTHVTYFLMPPPFLPNRPCHVHFGNRVRQRRIFSVGKSGLLRLSYLYNESRDFDSFHVLCFMFYEM